MAVLLALAAVWVVGLVQYRPAGVADAWKRAASVPGFTLFLGGAAFIWLLFCVQQPMFTQWDEFTAWGLAPKMVVERGAFYVADPVNLKASFTYPATSLITFLFQPFGPWAEWACLAAIDTLALACLDSDYFCMNLIDAANGADLWAANGRMTEGKAPRRSSLAPWKRYVSDIEAFKRTMRGKYVFAEECLEGLEPLLSLPVLQGEAGGDELPEDAEIHRFYYVLNRRDKCCNFNRRKAGKRESPAEIQL